MQTKKRSKHNVELINPLLRSLKVTRFKEIEKTTKNIFDKNFGTGKTPVKLGKNDRYFYMDFNDTNFPVRLKQGCEEIGKFLKEKCSELGIEDISQLQVKGRMVEECERKLSVFHEIDTVIKNKIDFIFNYNVSNDVFGIAPCIWITKKGEFYFDNFLNGLLPLVEENFGIKLQSINNHFR